MKKTLKILPLLLLIPFVSGCSLIQNYFYTGETSENSGGNGGNGGNTGGNGEGTGTVEQRKSIVLDSVLSATDSSYSSGNYGSFYSDGVNYEYYRTTVSYDSYLRLLGKRYQYEYLPSYPSCIYNTTPIKGINGISITYEGESINSKLVLFNTPGNTYEYQLTNVDSFTNRTFEFGKEQYSYFAITCDYGYIEIQSLTIFYTNVSQSNSFLDNYSGYRYEPVTYSGTLTDGVSSVYATDADGYSKKYTYYSSSYVLENSSSLYASDVAYTDPVDVSNYYMAFHAFPANFYYKNDSNSSELYYYFGEYARLVSTYTRTDGYANAVPYNTAPDTYYPYYHELDIDLDGSYRTSNRGVGRLVVWENGFSCYDLTPVIVYTDDHYATFREYNNYGGFGPRFNAQSQTAHANYCPLTTY
ncbi:MAG: hypothetical protein K6C32_01215 [Bacilli bacterium]|nr:hypothetical protein [Bacilli bacterium]